MSGQQMDGLPFGQAFYSQQLSCPRIGPAVELTWLLEYSVYF